MPQMSGFEVCRILRQTYPRDVLPIVFLSAMSRGEDRVAGLAHGANDYLIKPISKEELLTRVGMHLELLTSHRHQARELADLRGLLPMCAHCKNIRDDDGFWNQIESYLAAHSELELSHGICPDCARRLYGDLGDTPSDDR
ncbi:MAG: response regulator, partial [Acidobacteriota bacterium]